MTPVSVNLHSAVMEYLATVLAGTGYAIAPGDPVLDADLGSVNVTLMRKNSSENIPDIEDFLLPNPRTPGAMDKFFGTDEDQRYAEYDEYGDAGLGPAPASAAEDVLAGDEELQASAASRKDKPWRRSVPLPGSRVGGGFR